MVHLCARCIYLEKFSFSSSTVSISKFWAFNFLSSTLLILISRYAYIFIPFHSVECWDLWLVLLESAHYTKIKKILIFFIVPDIFDWERNGPD